MTQPLTETLVAEVRAELARKRISAASLAQELGRSEAYVSRRLSGETPLDINDLSKIAELLGMSPVDLLDHAMQTGPDRLHGRSPRTQPPSAERNGQ